MTDPIEVTTRYATTVEDLAAAWAFVMDHIDKVGGDPGIDIRPIWQWDGYEDSSQAVRRFTVVVDGMVEEPTVEVHDGT